MLLYHKNEKPIVIGQFCCGRSLLLFAQIKYNLKLHILYDTCISQKAFAAHSRFRFRASHMFIAMRQMLVLTTLLTLHLTGAFISPNSKSGTSSEYPYTIFRRKFISSRVHTWIFKPFQIRITLIRMAFQGMDRFLKPESRLSLWQSFDPD